MKKLILLLTTLLIPYFIHAGDAANGKKLYKKKACKTCHKKDGMGKAKLIKGKLKLSPVAGPRIAGLDEKYIVEQLQDIQSKKRKSRYLSTMRTKIKKLTKKDFEDLATFISKKIKPSAGKFKGMFSK